MKLTAKLLKKIIREAVKGGIPGINKYYSDDEGRLDPESAKQAAELSGMFGKDIEAEDVDESILIEVKEIMADFVEQFYYKLVTNPALNGSYNSQLLDLDQIHDAARKRIDSIIDGSYYINSNLSTNIIVSAIMMAMHRNKAIRTEAQKLRLYVRQMRDAFSSYDDLMSKLPPDLQKVLKKLNIGQRIDDRLNKLNEAIKAQRALKMQPVSNYQNHIRLANSKKEIANILDMFDAHLHELKDFMIKHFEGSKPSLSSLVPYNLVIDPEYVQHKKDGIEYDEVSKTISLFDKKRQRRSFLDIIDEVEQYVSPRISGDFVDRYADPQVKQKFLQKEFKLSSSIIKQLIKEELERLLK